MHWSFKSQVNVRQRLEQMLLIQYLSTCIDVLVKMYTLRSILARSIFDVWYLRLLCWQYGLIGAWCHEITWWKMISVECSLISFLVNFETLTGGKIRRMPTTEMDYGMGIRRGSRWWIKWSPLWTPACHLIWRDGPVVKVMIDGSKNTPDIHSHSADHRRAWKLIDMWGLKPENIVRGWRVFGGHLILPRSPSLSS